MKAILLALLIGSASAQTFTTTKGRYRADFNECQQNHSKIYDKALAQVETQLEAFNDDFEKFATSKERPELRQESYRKLFATLLVKKVMLQKLKQQFNSRSLHDFLQAEHLRLSTLKQKDPAYRIRPFLIYEQIEMDLEKALKNEISNFSVNRNAIVANYFKLTVGWQFTKTVLTSTFSLFYKVGAGLFAHLSASAMKAMFLNIGSQLFINAAKGTIITLLVDPFLGARLPPETEWTDLLDDYPELIIFPEWMLKAKVGDGFAWQTHCQALTTRTSHMERRLEHFLKKDQKDFEANLAQVNIDLDFASVERMKDHYRGSPTDNTRVIRPPVQRK